MRIPRIPLRRPGRPIAVLVGVLVGLGALGGATGAVLGGIGSFAAAHEEHHSPGHGRGFDMRHGDDLRVPQAQPVPAPAR